MEEYKVGTDICHRIKKYHKTIWQKLSQNDGIKSQSKAGRDSFIAWRERKWKDHINEYDSGIYFPDEGHILVDGKACFHSFSKRFF